MIPIVKINFLMESLLIREEVEILKVRILIETLTKTFRPFIGQKGIAL